ncbi:phosphodiester glycosidase family protein [Vulcanococcus sp.]|uniref:phosphodiester glycosidase family protein n=1 Tax=Vulcanococcus sp. TaxID=2856995 RepID=UPI003BFF0CC5
MALLPALAALHPGLPLLPPPPLPTEQRTSPRWSSGKASRGSVLLLNGKRQQARWLIEGHELWLPLEVLEGQLGVSRSDGANSSIQLEWFGVELSVPAARQRSLDDEVAVPVSELLERVGVQVRPFGKSELSLDLPARQLQAIRSRDSGISGRRIVLDLSAPAMVRSGDGRLTIAAESNAQQRDQLQALGLAPNQEPGWLTLAVATSERLTLQGPWRLVLDLPAGSSSLEQGPERVPQPRDNRLALLQRQGLAIDRKLASIGGRQVLINSVRLDPRRTPLDLRPLNNPRGMKGLSSLSQLARSEAALIAVNGGYFNRVNRLPLGALKDNGQWLSGPILNRGAVGWGQAELPQFGRLQLTESVVDEQRQSWPIASLNSGYVQKGLARYTSAWGSSYQAITGQEAAVLLRHGVVMERFEALGAGSSVPLRPGEELLVARGGAPLPGRSGERLQLLSRSNDPVGDKPFVLGGGPLLLQRGLVTLNGRAEGFSSGFLNQGAPRTVIASDGENLWLLTLQGVNNAGPTLMETALLLKQEGLKEALNLDGGSSTGLVLADVHTVKGRGVAAAVHNGLGLVPRGVTAPAGTEMTASTP